MSSEICTFDRVFPSIVDTLRYQKHESVGKIYVIRDLHGRIRLAASIEANDDAKRWLRGEAEMLRQRLGVRSFAPDDAILFLDEDMTSELDRDGQEILPDIDHDGQKILPDIFFVDRLLTGHGWWSVDKNVSETPTYTLYSVKGGVGRSTTAAVLAWHLAHSGENVLVVDLDLESPGISSAMLDASMQPEYGVVDWFVEDLVGQGEHVLEDMIARPAWHQDCRGDVRIVPAHGARPGEYLAKLGRAYLDKRDTVDGRRSDIRWTQRLEELLCKLRRAVQPTIVLLESRSGLHDIAAATVTDLSAHVLMFATNAETSWQDYGILFEHWKRLGLARDIRQRLSIVSSLTPELGTEEYLREFRRRSWALFQDHVYDQIESADDPYGFAFELQDDDAPHNPMPIHWTRGLAAGASLRHLEGTTVELAYGGFLARFDELQRSVAQIDD